MGDWVLVNPEAQIEHRLDRLTLLKRKAAGVEAKVQYIGANIDVLFITTSCNKDFNIARLERYLILARGAGIQPVIILTKADLASDPQDFEAKAQKLDQMMPILTLDARDTTQVDSLLDWWRPGQTAALLGSSGVGKTTLLNTLAGVEESTAGIREDDAKGRHTTTARGLYAIKDQRWLIDTPGMRELGLYDAATGVEAVFADVLELALQCKFSDCQHDEEPGCAIQGAIGTGELDPGRLKRWQKLEREERRNSETIAESRERRRKFAKHVRSVHVQKKILDGHGDR